jgi:hypothetical protein
MPIVRSMEVRVFMRICVGKEPGAGIRVARLMREQGLGAVTRARRTRTTSTEPWLPGSVGCSQCHSEHESDRKLL